MEPVPVFNRRSFKRVPAAGIVQLQSAKGIQSGYLVNVSQGGIMVKARDLPAPDEEIGLTFQLFPSTHILDLKAVVVWAARRSDGIEFRGMGARFVDLTEEDKKQIEDYACRYESARAS